MPSQQLLHASVTLDSHTGESSGRLDTVWESDLRLIQGPNARLLRLIGVLSDSDMSNMFRR